MVGQIKVRSLGQSYYLLRSDVDRSKWLWAPEKKAKIALLEAEDLPIAHQLSSVRLEPIVETKADERLPILDFPPLYHSVRCFSRRAADALVDLLEPNGEFIPVEGLTDSFVIYHVLHVCDALDESKSDLEGAKGAGKDFRLRPLIVLAPERIDADVFRISQSRVDLIVSDRFKTRVAEHRLTGFVFDPVSLTA